MKRAILTFLVVSTSLFAKAPVWDEGSQSRKRFPAQAQMSEGDSSLDKYLDMSCHELVDQNSKDEFIRFFRSAVREINPDLCSLVKEEVSVDFDISQSERETIGLGTFSNLVEAHYHDFMTSKRLTMYQDMDCSLLMDPQSRDQFIVYLQKSIKEDEVNLCPSQSHVEMDSDVSQAQRPIGLGTYSKIIEEYYNSYLYRQ